LDGKAASQDVRVEFVTTKNNISLFKIINRYTAIKQMNSRPNIFDRITDITVIVIAPTISNAP